MRRGQRAGVAPEFLLTPGRVLVTARYAAELTGRPLSTIRARRADAVACDVATGALYWDGRPLGIELGGIATQHRSRNVGRKGPAGHAAGRTRTVT